MRASFDLVLFEMIDTDLIDFGEIKEVGRSYTASFRVCNLEASNLAVSFDIISDEKAGNYGANQWLAFVGGESHFDLQGGDEKEVKLRVAIPEDAKSGSYYATILAKEGDATKKIPVRLDLLVENAKRSGEVSENYLQSFGFSGELNAHVKVKSTGNIGFEAVYILRQAGLGGDFKEVFSERAEIVPGSEYEFKPDVSDEFYGVYKIEQIVSYVNADGRRVENVLHQNMINLPLWLPFIICGGLVALAAGLFVVKKMNKGHDAREAEIVGEEGESESSENE